MASHPFEYKRGDIVRRRDSPCEVINVYTPAAITKDCSGCPVLYIIDKRTLLGEFVLSDDADLEFVRRPADIVCANGGHIRNGRFILPR